MTKTTEASVRLLARETYRKTRSAHPHMPHEDTAAGQMKLDRLFDILWKNVQAGGPYAVKEVPHAD